MADLYLGLGSNQDATAHMRLALAELARRFTLVAVSPVYLNKAVGFAGGDFLNAVACVSTTMTPQEVCDQLEEIHDLAGRHRGEERFASRTLDIDLLLYDNQVIDEPRVMVPRPDILDYSFVLKPLSDIAPDLRHPVTGRTMADHWQEFDAGAHPLLEVGGIL